MQTNPSSKLTVKTLFAAMYHFSSAFSSEVWNDFVFELSMLKLLGLKQSKRMFEKLSQNCSSIFPDLSLALNLMTTALYNHSALTKAAIFPIKSRISDVIYG